MNFKQLETACRESGITEVEIYRVVTEGTSVTTFNTEVDQNLVYNKNEMYIRGVYGGHIAALYVERDEDAEISEIVRRLIENASVIESNDPFFIYGGSEKYDTLPVETHDFGQYTLADRLALCRRMENYIKEKCDKVVMTQAEIVIEKETVTIENSNGLSVSRTTEDAAVFCNGVVSKDGDTRDGYYMEFVKNLSDIDYDKLLKQAVERPLSQIGAQSVESAAYPVVFENKMFASLLGCFLSMFSADAVIKKLSLLDGKVGERVFGENVTLYDDPLLECSHRRMTFDDEGVATFKKTVVENGVLKTYLHSLKTARMLDAAPTGNGFKDGSGAISVGPTNLCLVGGDRSFDEMIAPIHDGILITSMMGQHAGVNPTAGTFNLQSSGFRIRDGKVAEPVTLIVVSGNILDVLSNIVEVSNDFEASRAIACGSVYVKELSVSGKV